MRARVLIPLALVTLMLAVAFSNVSFGSRKFVEFQIMTPEEIPAEPGDAIVITGNIMNNGMWWLHNFNLTVSGLPDDYTYTISPQHFNDVRIIYNWNSDQGVYRSSEIFLLAIKVPDNASGLHAVNITGQESSTWRQAWNSSIFVLKVTPQAKLSVSDIIVPENVTVGQLFNINMTVVNEGTKDVNATATIDVPADWSVIEKTKSITVNANSSTNVLFTVTPTNTSGPVSVYLEYPYKQTILNLTKVGPLLTPVVSTQPTIQVPTGLNVWVQYFESIPTWALVAGIIILAVIIWNVWSIYQGRKSRKEPEEMKKKEKEE